MGSSREVVEEARKGMVVENKVFVAVSKVLKESKSTLSWALQNSNGKKICIIYVHVPAKMIPMPMGGKFPASQVGEKELNAFREQEDKEMHKILDGYLQCCAQVGAHAEKIHIEMDSIEEGIVEIITQQRIGRLVMGAAADSRFSRKMVEPKSIKANYVRQHAPDFCHIRFICRGRLICVREGLRQPSSDIEGRSSNSLESDQIDAGILSQVLDSIRISDFGGSEGSSDRFDQSSRASFSQSSILSLEAQSAFSSPCSSFSREGVRESDLELLVLPETKIKHQESSPPSVLERSMNDDLYDQLVQAMEEADNSKREAFEESMRRRKAEKEAMEAIRKAKTAERLYFEEVRRRKDQEEELAKRKEELEFTKCQLKKVLQELQKASDQRLSLETQYEKSKLTEKEMEEKMFSAVDLLQKYKNEREELQVERDRALQEAEVLRKQFPQGTSSSHVPFFFSEFSFSDLEKATDSFHPSLKIGEGGYGSIYKGFLRQTQVAVKVLNPNSRQGPREFGQEVDVLSKLRHPNLVTLIGACPESWALVYEYLSGGSLEDRLVCKDNTPPLAWQTRIQIATELCAVLIFLHSSRPTSIIHGDIKPSNILLDDNFVCKLADFGICRVISHSKTSLEETTRCCTTEPKGTFTYMDPEFLTTGELTPKSDIYSFGIILLRLLTGRPAMGITKEVEYALGNGNLNCLLDPSAGDWPFVKAEQLARMALRCCDMNGRNRPDLESDIWRVLEPMKASSRSLSMLGPTSDDQAPHYFICPIFQELMEDPQIASDGFTYEAEAIRGWLDSGHDTSPMTDAKLANHDFIPNHALRSAIQELDQFSDGFQAPVSSVQEAEVKAFQECERKEALDMLDDCLRICALKEIPSKKVYIEKETVTDGILELISQLRITNFVMGAGPNSKYSRRMTKPLSKKANYVLHCAPDFCHIWFVCKDQLIYTREGVKQPYVDVERRPSNVSDNDKPDAGISSQELSFGLRLPDFDEYESSPDSFDQSPGVSLSQSSTFLSEMESVLSSPSSSFAIKEVREFGLQLLALPQTINQYQDLSPPSVLEENKMSDDDPYEQLEQAMTEAENSKREAFEESMRRLKAEKKALVAARKVKAAQRLYFEELRQRKEIQEELAENKKEIEVTKSLLEKVSQELQEALHQKLTLESQFEKSCNSEKEMEDKLLSAVDLLQKFKNRRDELHVERDHALLEAKELRKQLSQGPSSSCVLMFSEFSLSDLEVATNYFDPSLKIGGGGNGSTYKGFLHHIEVAIKMLKPNTIHGAREFKKEMDILSKLRHPNLVTLFGACPESCALVFEYLPRGSLEDRLNCKDNTHPLPWQTRIQIATQLCSVLNFLHSRQPSSIIHGDLKPANILLDDNFVCKLRNFGICHIISNGGTSVEQTMGFITSDLKGTFTHMDPEFLATGELTPKSDIYSFGVILLRLLTGKPAVGITKEVECALDKCNLICVLDPTAGDWPFVQAEQLARMALRCCDMNQRNRPDLALDIWRVLEPMKATSQHLSKFLLASEDRAPHYFICPIFQEIMEDPQIASDGFTYEAEAIRGWLESGHYTSPMTNVSLANHDLIPNRALRSAIQEWLQHHSSG
ncbi:hypothetical protein SOVF_061300 isoform A [Spinacia oleracea]|nr:hypothetical protein SOVF_061300 isoform A [Spinacia oleracea]